MGLSFAVEDKSQSKACLHLHTAMALSNSTWTFTPIVETFPQTVLPNVAYWNVTNGADLEYQVSLSWPLDWPASREVENKTALTMYV